MKKHLAFILLLILTFNNSFAKEGKKYYATSEVAGHQNSEPLAGIVLSGKDPLYKQYSSKPVYKTSIIYYGNLSYSPSLDPETEYDTFDYFGDIPNWHKHNIYFLEFVCLKPKTLPDIMPEKSNLTKEMIFDGSYLGERDPNCDCSKYPFTSKAEQFEEYKDDPCVGWKKYTKEEWELMQKPIINNTEYRRNLRKLNEAK